MSDNCRPLNLGHCREVDNRDLQVDSAGPGAQALTGTGRWEER
jgi:hypothetical protein